jgi:glycosyltransferase involved in cell wall biosynthesis
VNISVEKLSVIIPAYNEAGTIVQVLEKVMRVELPDRIKKEIIVVDDCSVDDTNIKIERTIRAHPDMLIKHIKLDKNRGKGYAVRTGIIHSTGEIVIIQDADLEYDPDDYTILLQPILSGEYKVVYGSRLLNKKNNYSYRSFYWGGRFVSFVTSLLFGQKITDEPTCYKMFEASLLKSIPLTSDRFGFCPEVTAKILRRSYKIKEIPIHYYPRSKKEGKKIKWSDGIEAICILIRYRFIKR